jgi:hypothetical protein
MVAGLIVAIGGAAFVTAMYWLFRGLHPERQNDQDDQD